jgi:hypothetical protein
VACVSAQSAIALHSLTDFNLYIPANAMLLAWIAGMAVGAESAGTTMDARKLIEVPNASSTEPVEIGARFGMSR